MEQCASYRTRSVVAAFFVRSLAFALVWWAISVGQGSSFSFGVPAVLLAAAISVRLSPPPWPRIRGLPALSFLPYFLGHSFLGGVDVARRAFDPRLPLSPGFVRYPVKDMGRVEKRLFVLTVNVLPGTLAVRLNDDCLRVHAVDATQDIRASLDELETRIAGLVGRTRGRA